MNRFCDDNGIKVSHGAPRTAPTQGLVERANRTWKENTRSLIMSTARKVDHWCETTLEVSYTMNISHHSTIKTSPYEAVYGFKPHRENSKNPPETEQESQIERQRKRQKIQENQKKCNQKMLDSSCKKTNNTFKVNNIVSIKIDKVDKSSALHPNLLIAKIVNIHDDSNYARVVTPFSLIKGWVATNRLNHCTATNVTFNSDKEITFTAACKSAAELK